jgi:hypothetical protein
MVTVVRHEAADPEADEAALHGRWLLCGTGLSGRAEPGPYCLSEVRNVSCEASLGSIPTDRWSAAGPTT